MLMHGAFFRSDKESALVQLPEISVSEYEGEWRLAMQRVRLVLVTHWGFFWHTYLSEHMQFELLRHLPVHKDSGRECQCVKRLETAEGGWKLN